jgi:hypothetical protein
LIDDGLGRFTSSYCTALEDPVPQSTLIKVASKRCCSVEPLKQPTSSAAASRALRNAVDIIDHIGSSSCVNQADVIGRKHGRISVKLIALAGACLRLLIKVIKFIPRERF